MGRAARVFQFIGMIVVGIGLIYGIAQNNMSAEFLYLGSGIVLFLLGYWMQGRG